MLKAAALDFQVIPVFSILTQSKSNFSFQFIPNIRNINFWFNDAKTKHNFECIELLPFFSLEQVGGQI